MKKTIGIYCIENKINGKKYIGQSINCEERIKQHIRDLKRLSHENIYLQRSFSKNGFDNFSFFILEECNLETLDDKEIFYIKKMNSYYHSNGYNIENGGKSGGERFTTEMKNKISEGQRGKSRNGSGYVGISKKSNKWESAIGINGKQVYIGRYSTPEAAALAYDKVSLENFGKTYNFELEYVKSMDFPNEKVESSSFMGVTKRLDKRRGREKVTWRARIMINNSFISLGDYETEKESAIARDNYIIENNLQGYKLNFPERLC